MSKEGHIRPAEYYDMMPKDEVLGNKTLGQLLINKAMGFSSSEEFIYQGSKGKYGSVDKSSKTSLVSQATETAAAKKGVQVRVLMWCSGLLASLGAQNAPGFIQSKFTQTIQSCLNAEIGKLITEGLGGVALDAIMKGKDWEKVSTKINRIFVSIAADVTSNIGGKLGDAITGLGSGTSKKLVGVIAKQLQISRRTISKYIKWLA